jgi:predicted glycoside hydrolase/deacetylase ChbG (UPF0249 family)
MSGIRNTLKQAFLRTFKQLLSTSIQKRLGYSKNTKLLIIHADDLGLSAAENAASIEALKKGIVNSGSIMTPCPGFNEIAEYAKNHPESDLGVHLTLTNEWDSYKWKPLTPWNEVRSLVDDNGFFFKDKRSIQKKSSASDIEKELRAQINFALNAGIDITHLDSHMFIAFSHKVIEIYFDLGKEYKLPVLLTKKLPLRYLLAKNSIIVNELYYAEPEDYVDGIEKYYRRVLESIKPGLSCILIHPAFDNNEMKEIMNNQVNGGSAWRQSDFDFFTSDICRQLIIDNNIKLATWREIRDKLIR